MCRWLERKRRSFYRPMGAPSPCGGSPATAVLNHRVSHSISGYRTWFVCCCGSWVSPFASHEVSTPAKAKPTASAIAISSKHSPASNNEEMLDRRLE